VSFLPNDDQAAGDGKKPGGFSPAFPDSPSKQGRCKSELTGVSAGQRTLKIHERKALECTLTQQKSFTCEMASHTRSANGMVRWIVVYIGAVLVQMSYASNQSPISVPVPRQRAGNRRYAAAGCDVNSNWILRVRQDQCPQVPLRFSPVAFELSAKTHSVASWRSSSSACDH